MPLDVLNIVQLGCQWVVDVDDDDLPVGLLLVKESHDAQNLNLLDLPGVSNKLANLANVQWIVIALGLGLRVDGVGVFPGLSGRQLLMALPPAILGLDNTHAGECAVVPEITLMREAVANVSKLALLHILLDWVEELLLGELCDNIELVLFYCGV